MNTYLDKNFRLKRKNWFYDLINHFERANKTEMNFNILSNAYFTGKNFTDLHYLNPYLNYLFRKNY